MLGMLGLVDLLIGWLMGMPWLDGQSTADSPLVAVDANPSGEVANCAVRMPQPDYADWQQPNCSQGRVWASPIALHCGKGLTLTIRQGLPFTQASCPEWTCIALGFGFDKL